MRLPRPLRYACLSLVGALVLSFTGWPEIGIDLGSWQWTTAEPSADAPLAEEPDARPAQLAAPQSSGRNVS